MLKDLALLTVRLAAGASIAAHGAQKAFGWFEGPGPAGAAGMFDGLGFVPGDRFVKLASASEIGSGALIALGLGGPAGPALLISTMAVAARSVHWKNGWFAQKGGIEVAALYALLGLMLAVTGPGQLSLDAIAGVEEIESDVPGLLALGVAAAGAALILASRRSPEPPSEASQPSS